MYDHMGLMGDDIDRLPRRLATRTMALGVGMGMGVSLLRKAQDLVRNKEQD